MAGTPQDLVKVLTVPFDWHLSIDSQDELSLMCIPTGKNLKVEVLSVGYVYRVATGGGGTVDLEWRDALRDEENGLVNSVGGFVPTNVTEDRILDCDSTSTAEMADVLGTFIADLKLGLPLPNYVLTNITRAITHNSNANDSALLADQIGMLIQDVQEGVLPKVTFSNGAVDRVFDADSTTVLELSDIVQNLHDDLTPTADLATSVSLITGSIGDYNKIWEGSRILNQGDSLVLEITNTAGTDGEGYGAIVEYKVLQRS